MKYLLILGFTVILFNSCGNEEKPIVIYPENGQSENVELKKDSTLIEISDLPIHIDSTKYLIYPIGEFKMYGAGSSKIYFGSTSYYDGSFKISGFNQYEISGNLNNLKFQHIESEDLIPLTDKIIKISSVSFLRDIFNLTKRQYLVYRVWDQDTNRDKKLDNDDIETLYISKIDGTKFAKLTSEYQELIDWSTVKVKNRLYFRSIEDTNKNGEFDESDKIHYQYVNLNNEDWKVMEYQPI